MKYRFGVFEIDLTTRELRKQGLRVKLQQKPFQILKRLLQSPGELVTRAELSQHLWPDTNVLFDRSLNTAVNALRNALNDTSKNPRFIETRPGIGYRFIAPVEGSDVFEPPPDAPFVVKPAVRVQNIDAYRDYLKGCYFLNKMTEEDLRKSVAYLESALHQDPSFALAHAGLSLAYRSFALFGGLPVKEAQFRARECALAALRSDDTLAEAHVAFAAATHLSGWNWQSAEEEYLAALHLDANCSRGHHLYAWQLSAMGRRQEASHHIARAQELEPLSLTVNVDAAWILYVARDYSGALEQCWKVLTLEPKFAPAQLTLGLAYEQLNMKEEALVELENARTCSAGQPACIAALGHAYAKAERGSDAEECLLTLQRMSKVRYVSPYWLGILHAGLAQTELAVDSLFHAYDERDAWTAWIKVDPRLEPLRTHDRFQQIVRGVGL